MKLRSVFAAVAALSIAGAADAGTLISSDASYTGPDLNLTGYDNGSYNFTFGPLTLGDFTFTAAPGSGGNSGSGSVVGQGSYGLGTNGSFGGNAVYIGVDSATGYAQLLGTVGLSQLGFFFNYAPNNGVDNATISTLNAAGDVMESFDLETLAPISTPGGFNEFQFRGVVSDNADIYGLRFGGNYILASGTATGDIATGGVPEPATWGLMIMGFGATGVLVRRRRRTAIALTA